MCKGDFTVGIVGARGHTGLELIRLIDQHPNARLSFAASRSKSGQPVPLMGDYGLTYVGADPGEVSLLKADAVVLAVPDGATGDYVQALKDTAVLDLSSDHRFDDSWVYGLSEHNTHSLIGAKKISNPGCYATAVQLALKPLMNMLDGTPHAFGVSGYSGAGATPSPRNDLGVLGNGITPYKLVEHTHEKEISRHLGRAVRFSPHVAPFFRGIVVTIQARLKAPTSAEQLIDLYQDAYPSSGLIRVLGERVPRVQEIALDFGAEIGGITVGSDGMDIAVVCTIDNLLKGAASQAIQNLNLAFGFESELGLVRQEALV